jgi:GxxExxY protein
LADLSAPLQQATGMREKLNALTEQIIGAALAVHRELGPGMLEKAYELCLAFELGDRGLMVHRQKPLPLVYRGVRMDCGYKIDLLVDDLVVVEVKAIERLERVHSAQVLSYLRMLKLRVGLVINFNVQWLVRDGIRRVVNNFPE